MRTAIHSILLAGLLLVLPLSTRAEGLFESFAGVYDATAGDPACPELLEAKIITNLNALLITAPCKADVDACALTPWLPENGKTYREFFMDVDMGETLYAEDGSLFRFVTTSQGDSGLLLTWNESKKGSTVRRVSLSLERKENRLLFHYERDLDAEFGPLQLRCEFSKKS